MDQITTEQILWTVATLAGALVSAGWAWYIAVQKNRWWYEGFWMGLSLGPFGAIAVTCMPMGEPVAVVEPSNVLRARDDHERGEERLRKFLERQPEFGSTAPAPPAGSSSATARADFTDLASVSRRARSVFRIEGTSRPDSGVE
jgi:hypothetical protein